MRLLVNAIQQIANCHRVLWFAVWFLKEYFHYATQLATAEFFFIVTSGWLPVDSLNFVVNFSEIGPFFESQFINLPKIC